jgi:hypothetical protein
MPEPILPPRPDPGLLESRIEAERRRLQQASAVLTCAVLAVDHGVDVEVLGDVISVGRDLVDAAIVALDSVSLARPA